MKVKITDVVHRGGQVYKKNNVYDFPDEVAKTLVRSGRAYAATEPDRKQLEKELSKEKGNTSSQKIQTEETETEEKKPETTENTDTSKEDTKKESDKTEEKVEDKKPAPSSDSVEKTLRELGLNESVAEKLEKAGVTTEADYYKYVEEHGSIEEVDGIGPTYAEKVKEVVDADRTG